MRVVSFVPSWTETLIAAGIQVVGRTRFCVHPRGDVAEIPIVGGTKDWDLEKLRALKPDLLVLDREENPKFMAEQLEFPVFIKHVTALDGTGAEVLRLARGLGSVSLERIAERWVQVASEPARPRWTPAAPLPGLIAWGRRPELPLRNVVYLIWRNPWMTVSRQTFIGSILEKLGFASYLRDFTTRYPQIQLSDYQAAETLLLFASEPYPFLRKKSVLKPITHPYAFVDGESFSWFGVRSLKFLEEVRNAAQKA